MPLVNDVHSRLNETDISERVFPKNRSALIEAFLAAKERKLPVIVCGGRHSMGGQQFRRLGMVIDFSEMSQLLEFDSVRRLARFEAGATWPLILKQLEAVQAGSSPILTFRQKQTGADNMTLGGAVSSNIHGRGLNCAPFVQDIESFELLRPTGEIVKCSRSENRELFRLVVGGYGLFGIILSVELRLVPRVVLRRQVKIVNMDSLLVEFEAARNAGFEFGDWQFKTNEKADDFMTVGVMSLYQPEASSFVQLGNKALKSEDWSKLYSLGHFDKEAAWKYYSQFYLSTNGQCYESDASQMSLYVDGYHSQVDGVKPSATQGSEMIAELYVPPEALVEFLRDVRDYIQTSGANLIYGTVRVIKSESDSFMNWAKRDWACLVVNLHVDHSPEGISSAGGHFSALIDIALSHQGSFYLTYHRWINRIQLTKAYPQIGKFLEYKVANDPDGVIQSDWYNWLRSLLGT